MSLAVVVGALAVVLTASIAGCKCSDMPWGSRDYQVASPSQPNILLLVLDAWRKDSVGCYNPRVRHTPRIDGFARTAALFERPMAQSPCTINSAPSILFGVHPSEHGYYNYKLRVSDELDGAAELLAERGNYATVGLSTNPHVSVRNGLAQGFEEFVDNRKWKFETSGQVNERFEEWLDDNKEKKFFAMLWYIDTHVPYDPPDSIKREFVSDEDWKYVNSRTKFPRKLKLDEAEKRVTRQLYDASVAYFDREFGKLLDLLAREDLLANTAIILTSDHGEALWDDTDPLGRTTVGHGSTLNEPQIDIPLLVRLPGATEGVRVSEPVQHVDLLPTMLDIAGVTPSLGHPLDGESLVPAIARKRSPSRRPIISELITDEYGRKVMRSVRLEDHLLVQTNEYESETFDPPRTLFRPLVAPDAATPESAGGATALRARMEDRLSKWIARLPGSRFAPTPTQFENAAEKDELEKQLRALGYMQ